MYGAALPTLTASYTGLVNGDTAASLTTLPTLTTVATSASHVAGSPYSITASGAVDTDYSISYVAGSLNVTTAPLTITANNQTKVYGAALPTLTASYTGFVNGDTAASLTTLPTLTSAATSASHVAGSPYAINPSGAVDTDYAISYVAGSLNVTTVPLTITADNQAKVYGAALPTLTASFTGLVNGDTAASMTTQPTITSTATAASHVAGNPYTITASGAVDTDYSISYGPAGTLNVTQAPLTISANNQTIVFGAALPTLTASYTGLVNGDTAASLSTLPTLSTTATTGSAVGAYPISVSGAVDLDYSIGYIPGILTIAPTSSTSFFNVFSTGTPLTANLTLCLNGNGPLSCQTYNASASNLMISINISGHSYPNAGIRINNPGYTLTGCVQQSNGYCLFSISPSEVKLISIIPLPGLKEEILHIETFNTNNPDSMNLNTQEVALESSDEEMSADDELTKKSTVAFSIDEWTCSRVGANSCTIALLAEKDPYLLTISSDKPNITTLLDTDSSSTSKEAIADKNSAGNDELNATSLVSPDKGLELIKLNSTYIMNNIGLNSLSPLSITTLMKEKHYQIVFNSKEAMGTPSSSNLFKSILPQKIIREFLDNGTQVGIFSNLITNAVVQSISCGKDNICNLSGYYKDEFDIQHPLLAHSQDEGLTWHVFDTKSTPSQTPFFMSKASLQSIHCNKNRCLAVGFYTDVSNAQRPLLARSPDRGQTWEFSDSMSLQSIELSLGSGVNLQSIDCVENFCSVVGYYTDETQMKRFLLARSDDDGLNWEFSTGISQPDLMPAFGSNGNLYRVHCHENTCIAKGDYQDTANSKYDLHAKSIDKGVSWAFESHRVASS